MADRGTRHPASMEPRPSERGNGSGTQLALAQGAGLQWSHVLPNVETKYGCDGCTGRSCCFNGATSFRTWKRLTIERYDGLLRELQWSHVLPNVETSSARPTSRPRRTRFNGATSFRTWKHGDPGRTVGTLVRLQWS